LVSSWYYRASGRDRYDWAINEPVDTKFRGTVRPSNVESLNNTRPNNNGEWLDAEFTLVSGERVGGRLPLSLKSTWIRGDVFILAGKANILGTEGDFEIALRKVSQVASQPGRPPTFDVTAADGRTTRVTGLELADR